MQIIARELVLADLRLKPYSRTPEWNRSRLESAVPGHYVWLGDRLGNRNYKGGPIDIIDLPGGLSALRALCEVHPGQVVVMCMCPRRPECHRHGVLNAFEGEGYTVVELAPQLTR